MKTSLSIKSLLFICTSLLLSAASQAKDTELPDYKLDQFKPGKLISGEADTMKDLKGKVVVIEYWGTN